MLRFFNFCTAFTLVSVLSVLVNRRLSNESISRNDSSTDILTGNNPDTTVVILNWSRFHNVRKITSSICENLLEDVVDGIVVWNNNPRQIAFSGFVNTTCPEQKLKIVNSPENLYFQARYMACAQAKTPYCFIQDDDFLVLPEIIRALAVRMKEASLPSIHLQPADEMLSSELRTISVGPRIRTTFAWLGYGTIVTRMYAIEFLSLLDVLKLSVEEHQMADNYFTILRNVIPERWFEPGIPLGGGQPFTVGFEGEERNNRHIIRAAELLDAITSSSDYYHGLPYVNFSPHPIDNSISRAPCHGLSRLCVFETSIKLLSDIGIESAMSAATEILKLEKNRYQQLGQAKKEHYLGFPPSSAVDGRYETAFRSPESKCLHGLPRSMQLIRIF
ncbi:hypothetical protein CPB84DRAFT_1672881 [Gymnopilus junonius]|uniref:Uncharacterized protein n=1 Tax=Gymnopilus junonius TaxID=109634 RepID=A0A9P5P0I7_GYMJU|nr:hypothetical protein CPB84DRAFT_1672881 [Gymnopilus junonius]